MSPANQMAFGKERADQRREEVHCAHPIKDKGQAQ